MLPNRYDFIRQSLELHLFFSRIMKEHSFFLQIGFTSRDLNYVQRADEFRMQFDKLLADVVYLSNGVVSNSVLQSGEVMTPFTMNAEMVTAYLTGVKIPISLTQSEAGLTGSSYSINNPMLEQNVYEINERAIDLVSGLINFKSVLLSEINSCRLFTGNYPLLIDHILREAKLYLMLIQRLQNNEVISLEKEAYEQETFWNNIMAEHAKFISGLLDPTEVDLKKAADDFGKEFDKLTQEAKIAMTKTIPVNQLTEESMQATQEIRKFKAQGTDGLINCKIKSIIIPLLGDHTLREANHYFRLLNIFSKNIPE